MNKNELIALEFLKEKYPNEKIEKKGNPDFKVGDKYFEVKSFKNKSILFTYKQIITFEKINPEIILVDNNNVIEIQSWDYIKHKFKIINQQINKIRRDKPTMNEVVCYSKVFVSQNKLLVSISNNIANLLALNIGDTVQLKISIAKKDLVEDNRHFNEKGEVLNE